MPRLSIDPDERGLEFRAGNLRILVTRDGAQVFADVYVPGEDESIFSIRLDEDEQSVTVYDGRTDEGETIWERGEWFDGPASVVESSRPWPTCPSCGKVQQPGELRKADGRCYPACSRRRGRG